MTIRDQVHHQNYRTIFTDGAGKINVWVHYIWEEEAVSKMSVFWTTIFPISSKINKLDDTL